MQRDLTEAESFRYYFATVVLVALAVNAGSLFAPMSPGVWDYASALSSVTITVLGLMWCFASNGGRNGQAFIPRVVALGWVVTIRFMALMIVALFVQFVVLAVRFETISAQASWWDFVLLSVIEAGIYIRIGVHLRRIRAGRGEGVGIGINEAAIG